MAYDYFNKNKGVLVMEMDYSKCYQPVPMREIQSENFAKDSDVSMEICIVSYNGMYDGNTGGFSRHVISYTSLLDEKNTECNNDL
jgi:hypothetical protein